MYNLIEYKTNYSKSSGSLWQHYRHELALNNSGATGPGNSALFKCNKKITGQIGAGGTKDIEIIVSLKYFSNYWITLEMSLSNFEMNPNLTWSVHSMNQAIMFAITDTKPYVPVATLSIQDNSKLLQ